MTEAVEYIQARKSQLKFYREVELFGKIEGKGFVLYKRSGISLSEMRVDQERHPKPLYIQQVDKLLGLQEAQKGFNKQLENDVKDGNPARVKETLVTVVEETLREPRSGSLEGVSETVSTLVGAYSEEPDVLRSLIDMSYADYSTVLHSINVMALALSFAFYFRWSRSEAKALGLCALLHDVGKTKIAPELLRAPRKLTSEEFEEMKRHTTIGYNILSECKFGDRHVSLCALEHHEKLDGSGYPSNKTKISRASEIIGIIDCYESLTTDDRPYRSAMRAFDTLDEIIGRDVRSGKFNNEIYCQFVRSLGRVPKRKKRY
jgi:putative nucleotidyltransferase with HDIG domain